jgi:hypothetical protein
VDHDRGYSIARNEIFLGGYYLQLLKLKIAEIAAFDVLISHLDCYLHFEN